MNIQPRHLRIFVALAQSLNFSRTADQFCITQPSLSKAVKDLEETLELQLFERSTRSVCLTHSGRQLLPLATQLLADLDAGLLQLQQLASSVTLKLSIAALPSLASVLLPAVVAQLRTRQSAPLSIRVHDGSDSASVQRLIRYEVDFALASAHPLSPELHYGELLRDRFIVAGGKQWHHALKRPLSLEQLAELPVITMTNESSSAKYMSAAYINRGMVFNPFLQLDQVGTIASFVREGVGVTVLPYLGAVPLLAMKGIHCQEIVDGPVRSVGIVTRRATRLSKLAEHAIELVVASAEKLAGENPVWVEVLVSKKRWPTT